MIELSEEAQRDVDEHFAYVAERSPASAWRLLERLDALLADLEASAFEGPEEELTNRERVHAWPLPPLRIYYQRRGDTLYVVRIYHQKRRPIARRTR